MRSEPCEVAYGNIDDEDDEDDDFDDYDEEEDAARNLSAGEHAAASAEDRANGLVGFRRQRSVSKDSGSLLETGDDNRFLPGFCLPR